MQNVQYSDHGEHVATVQMAPKCGNALSAFQMLKTRLFQAKMARKILSSIWIIDTQMWFIQMSLIQMYSSTIVSYGEFGDMYLFTNVRYSDPACTFLSLYATVHFVIYSITILVLSYFLNFSWFFILLCVSQNIGYAPNHWLHLIKQLP